MYLSGIVKMYTVQTSHTLKPLKMLRLIIQNMSGLASPTARIMNWKTHSVKVCQLLKSKTVKQLQKNRKKFIKGIDKTVYMVYNKGTINDINKVRFYRLDSDRKIEKSL